MIKSKKLSTKLFGLCSDESIISHRMILNRYLLFCVYAVALLFGGWDIALQTLVLFMGIDWITGGILLPVIFKKSPKSENGRLESRAGWKGLCRKGMTLLFVLIAVRLDLLMGTNYLRDAVCIAFIANEALSILENAGLMGMPIPEVLRQAIDILNGKAEKYTESRGER